MALEIHRLLFSFLRMACNFTLFFILWSLLLSIPSLSAVLRVAGSLQKSTEVMKAMQTLVKIPEIQATMRELSKEMMKVTLGLTLHPAKGHAQQVAEAWAGLGRNGRTTVARH